MPWGCILVTQMSRASTFHFFKCNMCMFALHAFGSLTVTVGDWSGVTLALTLLHGGGSEGLWTLIWRLSSVRQTLHCSHLLPQAAMRGTLQHMTTNLIPVLSVRLQSNRLNKDQLTQWPKGNPHSHLLPALYIFIYFILLPLSDSRWVSDHFCPHKNVPFVLYFLHTYNK